MLIIDWDSEQYFTSWEEWFESFDYEKLIKEIMEEEEINNKLKATNFLINQAVEAKTITVLTSFIDDDFKFYYTEMKV